MELWSQESGIKLIAFFPLPFVFQTIYCNHRSESYRLWNLKCQPQQTTVLRRLQREKSLGSQGSLWILRFDTTCSCVDISLVRIKILWKLRYNWWIDLHTGVRLTNEWHLGWSRNHSTACKLNSHWYHSP